MVVPHLAVNSTGSCPFGAPAKPVGFVGKGGARERVELSPQAEAEHSGLCDDAVQNRFQAVLAPAGQADK